MREIGKRGKDNIAANKILMSKFLKIYEYPTCEARLDGCDRTFIMQFHHWPKRNSAIYIKNPEKLSDIENHVILVCQKCHKPLDEHKDKESLNSLAFENAKERRINGH